MARAWPKNVAEDNTSADLDFHVGLLLLRVLFGFSRATDKQSEISPQTFPRIKMNASLVPFSSRARKTSLPYTFVDWPLILVSCRHVRGAVKILISVLFFLPVGLRPVFLTSEYRASSWAPAVAELIEAHARLKAGTNQWNKLDLRLRKRVSPAKSGGDKGGPCGTTSTKRAEVHALRIWRRAKCFFFVSEAQRVLLL